MSQARTAPLARPPPSLSSPRGSRPALAHPEPDLSPTTNAHSASPTPLSADDADCAPSELTSAVIITSPLSLSEEFLRLSLLLSGTAAHWQARVHSLQRIAEIVRHDDWLHFDNLLPLLDRYRSLLVLQLADRRSAVVKQACSTIAAVSTALKGLLLLPAASASSSCSSPEPESSAAWQRAVWLSLSCDWLQQLLPNIPVTIRVISEATIACFHCVVANIAALPPLPTETGSASSRPPAAAGSARGFDYALIRCLLAASQHRHAAAREHSYRGLALLLSQLAGSCIAQEQQLDAGEAATIAASISAYKHVTASLSEPSSPLPFTVSPTPAGSLLFHELEVCIHRGSHDGDARVRAASRAALLEFAERCGAQRGERLSMSLPASSHKLLDRERQDRLMAASPSSHLPAASASSSEAKLSVRDRLRQQQKKPEQAVAKTITHATSGSPRAARRTGGSSGSSSPVRASIEYSMGPFLPSTGEQFADEERQPQPQHGEVAAAVRVAVLDSAEEAVQQPAEQQQDAPRVLLEGKPAQSAQSADDASSACDAAVQDRNSLLLCRLLDLENPQLTEKMQSYLMQDGVMESMLTFVTQRPPDFDFDNIAAQPPHLLTADSASSSSSLPLSSPSPLRRRPPPSTDAQHVALRRSYNVMTLLCQPRPGASLQAALLFKLELLLRRLLTAFLPDSNANLYHSCALLSQLFSLPSSQPLSLLVSSSALTSLFLLAFDHLHEGPVPALILTVLTAGEDRERKKTLLAALRRSDILAVLTSRICQPLTPAQRGEEAEGEEARCLACVDFILQLVDRVSGAEYLTSFLATIADADGLVARLTALLSSPPSPSHSAAQLSAASSLLLSLLSSCAESQTLVADAPSASSSSALSESSLFFKRKVSNPLFALRTKLLTLLRQPLPSLCSALLREETETEDVRFSGGYNVRCFSTRRMGVLRVIAAVCSLQPECCSALPRALWERLVDWMFLWRHNNFFLSSLSTLLVLLLRAVPDSPLQTDTLRYVLVELKLISRMIAAYHRTAPCAGGAEAASSPPSAVSASSTSTALDSSILVICSHLRLTASLHPSSSFLFSHLASHSQWRSFLPLLTQETTLQARYHRLPEAEDSAFMRALQSFSSSPLPPAASPSAGRGGDGIDLGSRFAQSLGYEQEATANERSAAARKGRKRRSKQRKKAKKALEAELSTGEDGEGEAGGEADDEDGEAADEGAELQAAAVLSGGRGAALRQEEDEEKQSGPERAPEQQSRSAVIAGER